MFIFQGTCPHCHSDRGFAAFGMSTYILGDYDYSKTPAIDRAILEKRRENNPLVSFSLAGSCLSCKKPVVATCSTSQKTLEEIRPCIGSVERESRRQVTVEHIFPSPVQHYSHPSLPEKVNNAFVDLQKMLDEKNSRTSSFSVVAVCWKLPCASLAAKGSLCMTGSITCIKKASLPLR